MGTQKPDPRCYGLKCCVMKAVNVFVKEVAKNSDKRFTVNGLAYIFPITSL